ncbi:MAG: hypothetical protein QNJ47_18970 [Nostocaceae cyanobacterium]|nr:hypothetical protein [Nostocaceae cyanobacterium]
MPFNIFSKRQKKLRGEVPDVYQYDDIPEPLRVQIVHIMNDLQGNPIDSYTCYTQSYTQELYRDIHDILCREYGKFSLINRTYLENIDYIEDVQEFLVQTSDIEQILDVVELFFLFIDGEVIGETQPKITPEEAIEELNARFKEHGVGYQYESGKIIRVDSQIIHNDAVKPALYLLSDSRFQSANEEFLQAHQHYRHKRYKECINYCLKAFESTMKIICDNQGWAYKSTDTAKKIISICFQNNLIPPFLETQFSSLRQNLESGIPTVRNKLGGHGQGSQPLTVPQHFAAYQLHMTASTIVFMVEAENS